MKVLFYDIDWDTDGEAVDLPKETEMVVDEPGIDLQLQGADLLSDKFCWCVNSFRFKILDTQPA